MSFVKLENAVKQYGNGENAVYALNDVSLEIEPKEIVVILGSSGSGKSTLLNILGGIDVMSKGKLLFQDRERRRTVHPSQEHGVHLPSCHRYHVHAGYLLQYQRHGLQS